MKYLRILTSKPKLLVSLTLIFAVAILVFYSVRPAVARYIFAQQFKPLDTPVQAKILVAYVYGIATEGF